MSKLDMDAARAVCEAATPGPWEYIEEADGPAAYGSIIAEPLTNKEDAKFIVHARTLLPQALDEITRLREALELYKDASYQSHRGHWDRTGGGGSGCPECIRARELRVRARAALAADQGEEGEG